MQPAELVLWLWVIMITWISFSNQYRLNIIDDRNKSKSKTTPETTQQLSLSDFMEEE